MAQQGVRIISGRWKHSVLRVQDLPGMRPTLVRLRKTLGDWMRPLQPLRVVDLFAGTGAVGFELASEGAEQVVLIEQHPLAVANLRANVARLTGASERIEIVAGDSLVWLEGQKSETFDLIVIDPPFKADFAAIAIRVMASAICGEQTRVYSEQPKHNCMPPPAGWKLARSASSGVVVAQLWERG